MTQDHDILFIPGPVEVEPELRALMAQPMVGHRSTKFVAQVQALLPKLQGLFMTKQHALFESCPATALMEAAIRNLVPAQVLHLTNGAFSERWAQISETCGRRVEVLAAPWGRANDPAQLATRLRTGGKVDAITITHNETSTGVINPLRELCAVVRELSPDTLILVDAVTSLAGTELAFDQWGIDLAFAGTQKCLALAPGLCVYALSARALAKAATVPGRGFLLDFVRAQQGLAKGETIATPCVPLVWALSAQLDRIHSEGLQARFDRHQQMRQAVEAFATSHGFEFFAEQASWRSPTVSCLKASGRDVTKLAEAARNRGYVLDRGYGMLKGQTFRIGHMGDHTVTRVRDLLSALA